MNPSPRHRALKFLRWFCREDYVEEIKGDLNEIFEMQVQESSKKAKRKFIWNVIKYFRPMFIKLLKLVCPDSHFNGQNLLICIVINSGWMKTKWLIIFIAFLLINTSLSFAQGVSVMYLANGDTIAFNSFGFNNITNKVILFRHGKNKAVLPEEIIGCVSDNIIMYNILDTQSNEYSLMPRILEGKILLYDDETILKYGRSHSIFLEKGKDISKVFEGDIDGLKKSEEIEILDRFIGDNAEILKLRQSDKYKHNVANLMKLIQKYNLAAFDDSPQYENKKGGRICIFRRGNNQMKEKAQVVLGDSIITMDIFDLKTLELPVDVDVKICVINGSRNNCNIIRCEKDFLKYYDISLRKNGEVEINNVSFSDYSNFIRVLRANPRKSN